MGDIRVTDSSKITIQVWGTISHWQLQGSLIPFKVWETIRVIDPLQGTHSITHVGTPLQGYHIPYRVWRDHKSYWQLQGSHIPYNVWGNHKSHWELQGSHIPYKVWGTIQVIDSYKFPTFKSYCTCEGTLLQGSHIPHNVWGTISYWHLQGSTFHIWYGDHTSHWQLQGSHIQIIL